MIKSGAVPVIHEALVADKYHACKVSQHMCEIAFDARVVVCPVQINNDNVNALVLPDSSPLSPPHRISCRLLRRGPLDR